MGRRGGGVTTGNYAGVLVPIPVVIDPGPPPVMETEIRWRFLRSSIPAVGLATGTSAIFRNGYCLYRQQSSASPIPTPRSSQGFSIPFSYLLATAKRASTDINIIAAEYGANGKLENAKIVANPHNSSATARIRGTASISYTNQHFDTGVPDPNGDSGGPIPYRIIGFKQSEATS